MNIIGKAMSLAISLAVASAAFGAELSKSVPKGWDEDFEAGKATAEKSGKLILLAFSGSDWCGWCVKMEKEIYSDKNFIAAAKKKFVLLMIDSPRDKSILSPLAAKLRRGSQALRRIPEKRRRRLPEGARRGCGCRWRQRCSRNIRRGGEKGRPLLLCIRRQGQDRVARVQEAQGERPERL